MHWIVLGGAFAIFWFLSLQVVLPMGNASAHETGEEVAAGVDPGAPTSPKLGLKIAVATGAAIVMWLVLYALVLLKVLDL